MPPVEKQLSRPRQRRGGEGEPTNGRPGAQPPRKGGASRRPSLWFYNWNLWLGAKQLLAEALEPLRLTPRDFWLLAIVHDAPMAQHQVASLCGLDPSTLVALLDDLERRGWVMRRRDPSDRRVQRISLAPAGAALFRQALPLARRAEARQLQALVPAERQKLIQLLRKLVNA